MKYFFVLGSNPTLSIAEISAVFPLAKPELVASRDILVLDLVNEIDPKKLIKRLGGTIKIGVMKRELPRPPLSRELLNEIIKFINVKKIDGKFKFGISCYGGGKFDIKPLAMEMKTYLRGQNISCRWVTSREPVLSSVVVEQNKLVSKGIEIIIFKDYDGKLLIGQTLSVQPFKELSKRDYGRPSRDDRSGMLPPKLAQIMINLSNTKGKSVILDPFCGSGTILTEAMLMGYENIIGSDISKKAVSDTRDNIEWIRRNYQLPITNYQLFNKNVLEISKIIELNSIDAIIAEPYLGPQRGRVDVRQTIKELEKLYANSLVEFKKVLKPDGRIVMVWPVFCATGDRKQETKHITPNINGFKIVNSISERLRGNKIINLTNRNTIVYGRAGQKVWREIVILVKKERNANN